MNYQPFLWLTLLLGVTITLGCGDSETSTDTAVDASNGIFGGTTGTSNGTTATTGGTGGTGGTTAMSCSADEDCRAGEICEASTCADGCRLDDDCAQNELCLNLDCVRRGVGCRGDEDCADGDVCDFVSDTCVLDTGACRSDINEPNDAVAEASPAGSERAARLSICAGDNDYFAVTLAAGQPIRVTLTFNHDDGDLQLQLIDGGGAPLLRSETEGFAEVITYTAADAETVYARVYGADGDVENGSYTLSFADPALCEDDSDEPNDNPDQATPLDIEAPAKSRVLCAGDEDWYSFDATGDQEIVVELGFTHALGDLSLFVYSANGTTEQGRSDSMTDGERITFDATIGTYYVKVETTLTEGQTPYTLGLLAESQGCVTDGDCPEGQSCVGRVCLPTGDIPQGTLRLADGANSRSGRLEIYALGQWGTICDDDFDLNDARVACRQLGFSGAESTNTSDTPGPEESPILLDDLRCTGNEMSLLNCPSMPLGEHNCSHFEDVAVVCQGTPCASSDDCRANEVCVGGGCEVGDCVSGDDCTADEVCFQLSCTPAECEVDEDCGEDLCIDRLCGFRDGTLRLVDGPNDRSGRLEIYLMGQWGTVCDDVFDLDLNAAEVACRQLGFPGAEALSPGAPDGSELTPIWLDDVSCTGNEQSLLDCPSLPPGQHNCSHFEDVGLVCQELPDCGSDPFEPNDTPATATVVPATIGAPATLLNGVLCAEQPDEDHFVVTTTTPITAIVIGLTSPQRRSAPTVDVLGADGGLLESLQWTPSGRTLVYIAPEPGVFYLRLAAGGELSARYDLTITLDEVANCFDRFEPNNSSAQATAIELGEYDALNLCGDYDRDDWFAVQLTRDQPITVQAEFLRLEGDIDLILYGMDGATRLTSSVALGDREQLSWLARTSGTHYIRATAPEPGTEPDYTLNVFQPEPPACAEDQGEPNENISEATPVLNGSAGAVACPEEQDFYAIAVDVELADISIALSDGLFGSTGVELIAPDGSSLLTGNSGARLRARVEGPAVYYARVFLRAGTRTDYEIGVDVLEVANCNDRFEPNNALEQAAALTLGRHTGLGICADFDPSDFFAVEVDEPGSLNVTLSWDNVTELAMELLTTDGRQITFSDQFGGGLESLNAIVSPGTYVIAIYNFDFAGATPYSLDVTLTPPPDCDDDPYEPNDTLQTPAFLFDLAEGAVACEGGDDDFFELIPGNDGQSISLALKTNAAFGLPGLELLDGQGSVVASAPPGPAPRLLFTPDGQTSYFVRVFLAQGASVAYDLEVRYVYCDDLFEPNDAPAQISALLAPGVYPDLGLCGAADAADWHLISVASGSLMNLSIASSTESTDLQLQLISTTGALLAEGAPDASGRTLTYRATSSGYLYLLVFSSSDIAIDYTLDYTLTGAPFVPPACNEDSREPDDDPLAATFITPDAPLSGQRCELNDDYYFFLGARNTIYQVNLDVAAPNSTVSAEIVAPDGETVLAGRDGATELIWRAVEENNYYIRVGGAAADRSAYTLTLTELDIPPGPCPDPFEPNQTQELAWPIASNFEAEGLNLCAEDSLDLYTLRLDAPGRIRITANVADAQNSFIGVNLTGADGLFIDYDDSFDGQVTIPNDGTGSRLLQPGVYTIQVNYFFGPPVVYDLQVEFSSPPSCGDDPFEPNNQREDALPLSEPALGAIACSDQDSDFYTIDVTGAGQSVYIETRTTLAFGALGVEIQNDQGDVVARAVPGEQPSLLFEPELVGVYFVRVFLAQGGSTTYDLAVRYVYCDDPFEPNDTPFQLGALLAPGVYPDLGLCGAADPSDWYLVSAAAGATITVEADPGASGFSDINVELYASTGALLQRGAPVEGATHDTLTHQAREGGYFFIQVFGDDATPIRYDLNVAVTGDPYNDPRTCDDEASEPNDRTEDAVPLSPSDALEGQICGFDIDVYAFSATRGMAYAVELAPEGPGRLQIELLRADGVTVLARGTARAVLLAPEDGVFFARITSAGADRVPYMLTLTENAAPEPCNDFFEPNQTEDAAVLLPSGEYSADVCNEVDRDDWFAIEVAAGASITVTLNFNPSNDVDMQIFDSSGGFLAASTGTSATESFTLQGLAAGTYYLQVYLFSGGTAPYTVTITTSP